MTKIILVRHCQAEGNEKRFFQGRIDTDITENGKRQIEATVSRLQSEPIDVVYSSPLKRALTTAKYIAESHSISEGNIILDDDLMEIDAGVWDGLLIRDIERLYPEESDNWNNHPERFAPEGSEGMKSVYTRTGKMLKKLINDNDGKCVCAISHGCAIRNILCNAFGKSIDELRTVPWGTNCAVSMLIADEDWVEVVIENDVSHLEGI